MILTYTNNNKTTINNIVHYMIFTHAHKGKPMKDKNYTRHGKHIHKQVDILMFMQLL